MKQRHRNRIERDVEALREQLADHAAPASIVGEGYGAVVAMHFAARYPQRVASIELTEPADLISLFDDGLDTPDARRVRRLHAFVAGQSGNAFGRWRAARQLVNFRDGAGAWKRLGTRGKARYAAELPKAAAEIEALLSASARVEDLSALTMPVTIRCRSTAARPLRRICESLRARLPNARLAWVPPGERDARPVADSSAVHTIAFGRLESCAA